MGSRARALATKCVAVGALFLGACQILLGLDDRPLSGDDAAAPLRDSDPGAVVPDATAREAGPDATARCPIGEVLCGDTCRTLTADPNHCGACFHSCLGGACTGRRCESTRVVDGPTGGVVVVEGREILRVVSGNLVARHMDRGTDRQVMPIGIYPSFARIAGTRYVVGDHSSRARVRIVDLTTGAVERTLYDGPMNPNVRSVKVRGDDVYFATRANVSHVRLDGTDAYVVVGIDPGSGLFVPDGGHFGASPSLDIDGPRLFFGAVEVNALYEVPCTGGTPTEIDRCPDGDPGYVRAVDGGVRWMCGRYLRDVRDGGATYLSDAALSAVHTSVDLGDFAYITHLDGQSGSTRLIRYDHATRDHLELGDGLPRSGDIAIDDRYVYIAGYDGGIYRVPR